MKALLVFKFWLLWVCCLFVGATHAQSALQYRTETPPILVNDAFTERAIGLDLDVFEDKSAQLGLEDVRQPGIAKKFYLSSKSSPSFGFTASAYWLRFGLNDARSSSQQLQAGNVLLTMGFGQIDSLDLWCFSAAGQQVLHQRAGDHVPPEQWPVKSVEPTFKLPPSANQCWLRVQSGSSLQLPLTLRTREAFHEVSFKTGVFQALYYGALLVMVAYNGLVAVATRSWAYGTYTLFLMCFGLFQATFNGLGYALLWPGAIGWADSALLLSLAGTGLLSTAFAMIILEVRQESQKLWKLGVFVLLTMGFCAALIPFLPYAVLIKALYAFVPFWAFFLIGSSVLLAWRGIRVAKIFLAAWFVFIFAGLIVIGRGLGILPINAFTMNALQMGSAIEFVMLSFALSDRIKTWQKMLLSAEQKIVEDLRNSELVLAQKVQERTAELSESNQALTQAKHAAEKALEDLKTTQTQLVQSEKMASLGVLVDNVAHELNSPIGAVKSSGQIISESLADALASMPKLFEVLEDEARGLFTQLVTHARSNAPTLSSREERTLAKALAQQLQQAGVEQSAETKARMLIKFNAQGRALDYLPLLVHPQSDYILKTANNIATVVDSAGNINNAVERVTRIVYALKAFSAADNSSAMMPSPLRASIDNAVSIYQSRIHPSVEIVYQCEEVGMVRCLPDDMVQVWSHLFFNALQSMKSGGKLTIAMKRDNAFVVVSVADTGSGIPDEAISRIFEPFFTTRTAGEGSGLGLAIVKKIIDKHNGRIEVNTQLGVGTTFSVYLPTID